MANPLVEIARLVSFLFLISCGLSMLITKDNAFWGYAPPYTKYNVLKSWWNPVHLTDADLLQYDGSVSGKPIYLAINGTIYDVSNGRKFYGPGGSYHFFAGRDAARAYVTSCFETDLTPDLRGLELMFTPADNPEVDALYTPGELKAKKEQERRQAKKEAHKALSHWTEFFAQSPKYFKVGNVIREPGWENQGEPPELCEKALKRRPKRQPPAREL